MEGLSRGEGHSRAFLEAIVAVDHTEKALDNPSMFLAFAVSYGVYDTPFALRAAELLIVFSMAVLALHKLHNNESFTTMILNYGLLTKKWTLYFDV